MYASDNSCIPELLKIAEVFYNAKSVTSNNTETDFTNELDISSRVKEIKELRELSSNIVESGLSVFFFYKNKLLDLLEKEKLLRSQREKALEFLDNLTKGGDSKKENEQIEKRVIAILQNQEDTLEQLDSHLTKLKQKEGQLDEEIKIKSLECERAEKRLEGLVGVKPKVDSEQIQLETELQHIYRIYVEKLRNQDYLEKKLEDFNEIQKILDENERNKISIITRNTKDQERGNIDDDKEIVVNNSDEEYNYKNIAKKKNNLREDITHSRSNPRGNNMNQFVNEDEDNEEEEDIGDNEEDDDGNF